MVTGGNERTGFLILKRSDFLGDLVVTVTGNVRNIRITVVRFGKDEDKLFLKI